MNKAKLLNIGSVLNAGAWFGKVFVSGPASAFLAQSFYRFSRSALEIPFQAIFYSKAREKGEEVDEFIVYREIVFNGGRGLLFLFLAFLFVFTSQLNIAFLVAMVCSLGYMMLSEETRK